MDKSQKKLKIYLGIPSTGTRVDLQTYFFRNIEKKYGDRIEFVYPTQCVHRSFHDFARCAVVDEFLATDCDILWFLDSDVVPPDDVLDIVTDHHEEWQAAGAPYPLWMVPPGGDETCVLFTAYKGVVEKESGEIQGIKMTEVPQSGKEFIDGVATGCMFIKREVFSLLEKPYFEFKYDPITRAFKEGEDLGFCLKLNKLGIKFFIDYSKVCKHYKQVCLLDVNNYAVSWANDKILQYDKDIRASVMKSISAAERMGYERAKKEFEQQGVRPRVSSSGLLLPNGY